MACSKELQQCQDDLKQARATLDRQRGELDEKKEALEALKTASGEKEAELLSEIRRLKQQAQKDKAELEKAQEQAKEVESPPLPLLLFGLKYMKGHIQIYAPVSFIIFPLFSVIGCRKDSGGPQQQPGAPGSKHSSQREACPHGTAH